MEGSNDKSRPPEGDRLDSAGGLDGLLVPPSTINLSKLYIKLEDLQEQRRRFAQTTSTKDVTTLLMRQSVIIRGTAVLHAKTK